MKDSCRCSALLAAIALLAAAPLVAQTPEPMMPPLVSATEAHTILVDAARWAYPIKFTPLIGHHYLYLDPKSIEASLDEISFVAKNSEKDPGWRVRFARKPGELFRSRCDQQDCWIVRTPADPSQHVDLSAGGLGAHDDTSKNEYWLIFGTNRGHWNNAPDLCQYADEKDACMHAAARFAGALNSLLRVPANFNAEVFHQKAAAWRAMAAKPEISGEIRTHRLLAEDAVKNNKPEEALKFYDEGVGLDPTWAQGWFNAALVAAQLNIYADAVFYMQNYLELMPDAADAASARDQISVWKYKAQKK